MRMPDLPQPAHPEYGDLRSRGERLVSERVGELDIGLDLDVHPKLRARLAELGSHFDDSVQMAEMIRSLFVDLKTELDLPDADPKRMMRAAVLHDIGKSGPEVGSDRLRFAVRRLFVTPPRRFSPNAEDGQPKTIRDFMVEFDFGESEQEEIGRALNEVGIGADSESILDFWRRHVDWTYEILQSNQGEGIDQSVVAITSTHHLLEGKNPAKVDLGRMPVEATVIETLELAQFLSVVDKYQAFRVRSGMGHEATMSVLNKIVDQHMELPEPLRTGFHKVLDVFSRNGEALESLLAGRK